MNDDKIDKSLWIKKYAFLHTKLGAKKSWKISGNVFVGSLLFFTFLILPKRGVH